MQLQYADASHVNALRNAQEIHPFMLVRAVEFQPVRIFPLGPVQYFPIQNAKTKT